MTFVQAFLLSAVQGFAELFPFSSLGLQAIIPHVAHWHLNTASPEFVQYRAVPLVVVAHASKERHGFSSDCG